MFEGISRSLQGNLSALVFPAFISAVKMNSDKINQIVMTGDTNISQEVYDSIYATIGKIVPENKVKQLADILSYTKVNDKRITDLINVDDVQQVKIAMLSIRAWTMLNKLTEDFKSDRIDLNKLSDIRNVFCDQLGKYNFILCSVTYEELNTFMCSMDKCNMPQLSSNIIGAIKHALDDVSSLSTYVEYCNKVFEFDQSIDTCDKCYDILNAFVPSPLHASICHDIRFNYSSEIEIYNLIHTDDLSKFIQSMTCCDAKSQIAEQIISYDGLNNDVMFNRFKNEVISKAPSNIMGVEHDLASLKPSHDSYLQLIKFVDEHDIKINYASYPQYFVGALEFAFNIKPDVHHDEYDVESIITPEEEYSIINSLKQEANNFENSFVAVTQKITGGAKKYDTFRDEYIKQIDNIAKLYNTTGDKMLKEIKDVIKVTPNIDFNDLETITTAMLSLINIQLHNADIKSFVYIRTYTNVINDALRDIKALGGIRMFKQYSEIVINYCNGVKDIISKINKTYKDWVVSDIELSSKKLDKVKTIPITSKFAESVTIFKQFIAVTKVSATRMIRSITTDTSIKETLCKSFCKSIKNITDEQSGKISELVDHLMDFNEIANQVGKTMIKKVTVKSSGPLKMNNFQIISKVFMSKYLWVLINLANAGYKNEDSNIPIPLKYEKTNTAISWEYFKSLKSYYNADGEERALKINGVTLDEYLSTININTSYDDIINVMQTVYDTYIESAYVKDINTGKMIPSKDNSINKVINIPSIYTIYNIMRSMMYDKNATGVPSDVEQEVFRNVVKLYTEKDDFIKYYSIVNPFASIKEINKQIDAEPIYNDMIDVLNKLIPDYYIFKSENPGCISFNYQFENIIQICVQCLFSKLIALVDSVVNQSKVPIKSQVWNELDRIRGGARAYVGDVYYPSSMMEKQLSSLLMQQTNINTNDVQFYISAFILMEYFIKKYYIFAKDSTIHLEMNDILPIMKALRCVADKANIDGEGNLTIFYNIDDVCIIINAIKEFATGYEKTNERLQALYSEMLACLTINSKTYSASDNRYKPIIDFANLMSDSIKISTDELHNVLPVKTKDIVSKMIDTFKERFAAGGRSERINILTTALNNKTNMYKIQDLINETDVTFNVGINIYYIVNRGLSKMVEWLEQDNLYIEDVPRFINLYNIGPVNEQSMIRHLAEVMFDYKKRMYTLLYKIPNLPAKFGEMLDDQMKTFKLDNFISQLRDISLRSSKIRKYCAYCSIGKRSEEIYDLESHVMPVPFVPSDKDIFPSYIIKDYNIQFLERPYPRSRTFIDNIVFALSVCEKYGRVNKSILNGFIRLNEDYAKSLNYPLSYDPDFDLIEYFDLKVILKSQTKLEFKPQEIADERFIDFLCARSLLGMYDKQTEKWEEEAITNQLYCKNVALTCAFFKSWIQANVINYTPNGSYEGMHVFSHNTEDNIKIAGEVVKILNAYGISMSNNIDQVIDTEHGLATIANDILNGATFDEIGIRGKYLSIYADPNKQYTDTILISEEGMAGMKTNKDCIDAYIALNDVLKQCIWYCMTTNYTLDKHICYIPDADYRPVSTNPRTVPYDINKSIGVEKYKPLRGGDKQITPSTLTASLNSFPTDIVTVAKYLSAIKMALDNPSLSSSVAEAYANISAADKVKLDTVKCGMINNYFTKLRGGDKKELNTYIKDEIPMWLATFCHDVIEAQLIQLAHEHESEFKEITNIEMFNSKFPAYTDMLKIYLTPYQHGKMYNCDINLFNTEVVEDVHHNIHTQFEINDNYYVSHNGVPMHKSCCTLLYKPGEYVEDIKHNVYALKDCELCDDHIVDRESGKAYPSKDCTKIGESGEWTHDSNGYYMNGEQYKDCIYDVNYTLYKIDQPKDVQHVDKQDDQPKDVQIVNGQDDQRVNEQVTGEDYTTLAGEDKYIVDNSNTVYKLKKDAVEYNSTFYDVYGNVYKQVLVPDINKSVNPLTTLLYQASKITLADNETLKVKGKDIFEQIFKHIAHVLKCYNDIYELEIDKVISQIENLKVDDKLTEELPKIANVINNVCSGSLYDAYKLIDSKESLIDEHIANNVIRPLFNIMNCMRNYIPGNTPDAFTKDIIIKQASLIQSQTARIINKHVYIFPLGGVLFGCEVTNTYSEHVHKYVKDGLAHLLKCDILPTMLTTAAGLYDILRDYVPESVILASHNMQFAKNGVKKYRAIKYTSDIAFDLTKCIMKKTVVEDKYVDEGKSAKSLITNSSAISTHTLSPKKTIFTASLVNESVPDAVYQSIRNIFGEASDYEAFMKMFNNRYNSNDKRELYTAYNYEKTNTLPAPYSDDVNVITMKQMLSERFNTDMTMLYDNIKSLYVKVSNIDYKKYHYKDDLYKFKVIGEVESNNKVVYHGNMVYNLPIAKYILLYKDMAALLMEHFNSPVASTTVDVYCKSLPIHADMPEDFNKESNPEGVAYGTALLIRGYKMLVSAGYTGAYVRGHLNDYVTKIVNDYMKWFKEIGIKLHIDFTIKREDKTPEKLKWDLLHIIKSNFINSMRVAYSDTIRHKLIGDVTNYNTRLVEDDIGTICDNIHIILCDILSWKFIDHISPAIEHITSKHEEFLYDVNHSKTVRKIISNIISGNSYNNDINANLLGFITGNDPDAADKALNNSLSPADLFNDYINIPKPANAANTNININNSIKIEELSKVIEQLFTRRDHNCAYINRYDNIIDDEEIVIHKDNNIVTRLSNIMVKLENISNVKSIDDIMNVLVMDNDNIYNKILYNSILGYIHHCNRSTAEDLSYVISWLKILIDISGEKEPIQILDESVKEYIEIIRMSPLSVSRKLREKHISTMLLVKGEKPAIASCIIHEGLDDQIKQIKISDTLPYITALSPVYNEKIYDVVKHNDKWIYPFVVLDDYNRCGLIVPDKTLIVKLIGNDIYIASTRGPTDPGKKFIYTKKEVYIKSYTMDSSYDHAMGLITNYQLSEKHTNDEDKELCYFMGHKDIVKDFLYESLYEKWIDYTMDNYEKHGVYLRINNMTDGFIYIPTAKITDVTAVLTNKGTFRVLGTDNVYIVNLDGTLGLANSDANGVTIWSVNDSPYTNKMALYIMQYLNAIDCITTNNYSTKLYINYFIKSLKDRPVITIDEIVAAVMHYYNFIRNGKTLYEQCGITYPSTVIAYILDKINLQSALYNKYYYDRYYDSASIRKIVNDLFDINIFKSASELIMEYKYDILERILISEDERNKMKPNDMIVPKINDPNTYINRYVKWGIYNFEAIRYILLFTPTNYAYHLINRIKLPNVYIDTNAYDRYVMEGMYDFIVNKYHIPRDQLVNPFINEYEDIVTYIETEHATVNVQGSDDPRRTISNNLLSMPYQHIIKNRCKQIPYNEVHELLHLNYSGNEINHQLIINVEPLSNMDINNIALSTGILLYPISYKHLIDDYTNGGHIINHCNMCLAGVSDNNIERYKANVRYIRDAGYEIKDIIDEINDSLIKDNYGVDNDKSIDEIKDKFKSNDDSNLTKRIIISHNDRLKKYVDKDSSHDQYGMWIGDYGIRDNDNSKLAYMICHSPDMLLLISNISNTSVTPELFARMYFHIIKRMTDECKLKDVYSYAIHVFTEIILNIWNKYRQWTIKYESIVRNYSHPTEDEHKNTKDVLDAMDETRKSLTRRVFPGDKIFGGSKFMIYDDAIFNITNLRDWYESLGRSYKRELNISNMQLIDALAVDIIDECAIDISYTNILKNATINCILNVAIKNSVILRELMKNITFDNKHTLKNLTKALSMSIVYNPTPKNISETTCAAPVDMFLSSDYKDVLPDEKRPNDWRLYYEQSHVYAQSDEVRAALSEKSIHMIDIPIMNVGSVNRRIFDPACLTQRDIYYQSIYIHDVFSLVDTIMNKVTTNDFTKIFTQELDI